tara:strand:- start:128 stop:889 length:762 start_codon:yes stop_codon:yes gene_type:complete
MPYTKEEMKEYNKLYRERNKDKMKEWCERNKEKIKEYDKAYKERNKEKIKEYDKERYGKNKEYYKSYRQKNKEKYSCKGEGCNTTANPKYKKYCAYCFQHLFPNDPLTLQIRTKTKEIKTRDYINSNFEGFLHDKPLFVGGCDCSMRRRIDHRKLINNTLLCIETDEFQHKSYNKDDEEYRYDDIYMALSCKYIFIRFNPDNYKVDNKNINLLIEDRFERLGEEIDKQINRIEKEENDELVEIVYLYYDDFIE